MLLSRRGALVNQVFALVASSPTRSSMSGPTCKVIDSAIHLWSDGAAPFPWANPPPADLQTVATADAYLATARAAGVGGALIVQPANHMYDHSYVTKALKEHGDFFRGMGLANPTLPPAEAVAELESLKAAGFVGVRFNAGAFEGGLTSEVGKALYKRAGELSLPVGVMAFKGLTSFVPSLEQLCKEHPETTLIIDHLGFFRQPAIGGQLGDKASNDEAAWQGLLSLPSTRRSTSRCPLSSDRRVRRRRSTICSRASPRSSRRTAASGSCGAPTIRLYYLAAFHCPRV